MNAITQTPMNDDGSGMVIRTTPEEVPNLTICAATFEGTKAPDREWIVPDMFPDRQVTLFTGDGGTGKSLIAMQLSVAVALRQQRYFQTWLGRPVIEGSVIYLGAEDEQDEMQRRLEDIIGAEKCSFADLSNLHIKSLAGEDALLATEINAHAPLIASPLYLRAEREIERLRPKLVVLDTLADMYPANENDRAKVRQFVGMLKSLAIKNDCAIVLLAHPSKSGMETGRGDSGSTAWNGSVRSRLYLTHKKDNEGSIDPNGRILTNMKNNYGRIGAYNELYWDNGVFTAKSVEECIDRKQITEKAERVFLKLLSQYTEQGRDLNSSSGVNYAPAQFSAHANSEGITKKMFRTAMDKLFSDGKIINVTQNRSKRIVKVEAENTSPETA